jgi:hypothetical protein
MTALFDRVQFSDKRNTRDGYMVTEARIARTGIQNYRGFEVGKKDMDIVRVYRPEEEVFKDEAMASFTSVPMTVDHPDEAINATNWKKYAVGFTGEAVARDGGFLRVPLVLKDAGAITTVNGGKAELSCGYDCDLEWTKGTTKDGAEYDCIQRNIRGNHLAIVSAGRAGSECRIGDADLTEIRKALSDQTWNPKAETSRMNTRTVVFDGISIETTDQGAQAIEKLQGQLAAKDAALASANEAHTAAIKAKDTELGAKDGEIEKLKKSQLDEKAIDALAEKKAVVLASAKRLGDGVDFAGKSVVEIRRLAVAKKLGDEKVKDRSDEYVEALFDHLVADAGEEDPVRTNLRSGDTKLHTSDSDKAWNENVTHLQNAWMGDRKGAA